MKRLLLVSIVGNVLMLGGALGWLVLRYEGAWPEAVASSEANHAPAWAPSEEFLRATSVFALTPVRKGEVVFAGDSQIVACRWDEWFGGLSVRSRGIVGDGVRGLQHRLDILLEGPPAQLFILAGGNDLYAGVPLEEVEVAYRELVAEVKRRSPTTQVFLLSTTPMTRNHVLHVQENRRARALNAALRALAPEVGAVYLDVGVPLRSADGALRTGYSFDGSHLNGAGCAAMASMLRPYIRSAPNRR